MSRERTYCCGSGTGAIGHNQPLRFLPESGRSPAIAGHDRKDSR